LARAILRLALAISLALVLILSWLHGLSFDYRWRTVGGLD
jgi:hypothetical protein